MDDAYIHFIYAGTCRAGKFVLQLSRGKGRWHFEPALGAAPRAGNRLGLPINGLAVFLAWFPFLRWWDYTCCFGLTPTLPVLACSLFVVLSGHMLWFSLSGMETTLFPGAGYLAILFYGRNAGLAGLPPGVYGADPPGSVILALVIAR